MTKLFSYWTGPVSWMERLSCASAIATGHSLAVYSPNPAFLEHENLGVEVRDIGEVFHDPALEHLRRDCPAHYADHVRLVGMAKGLGTWVDLDLVFLKPLPDDDYLFGWEEPNSICNAVLRLPQGSPALAEYMEFCARRPIPFNVPWVPLRKRIKRQVKRVTRTLQGRPLPTPLLGPATLTHFLRKHGLADLAKPIPTFYPLPVGKDHIRRLATDPDYMRSLIAPETVAVHLWRNVFSRVHGKLLPPCQWLADAYHLHCGENLRPWTETIPRAVGRPKLRLVEAAE
jgi:hypothetical protein